MSRAIEYNMGADRIDVGADADLDDMMDKTWIDEIRKTENVYNKYYVTPMREIDVFFLLVRGDEIVGCETGRVVMGTPNVVGWGEMFPLISRYMSRGRKCTCSGRPCTTMARPAMKVIRLDQRNDGRSPVRSKITRVAMGTTMLTARVIRKMPMMKPMILKVGNAM